MKRIFLAILTMASLVTFVGCNENDELEIRPTQTYLVDVLAETELTAEDQLFIENVMLDHQVDVETKQITTNNLSGVVESMREQLSDLQAALMIGFRLTTEEVEGRYVATITVAGTADR